MSTPEEVAAYYDRMTSSYLNTYGPIIQAYRPTDDELLNEHILRSVNLEDGMKVLDAGCGVAGPALSFAKRKNVDIDAITISEVQVAEGLKSIEKALVKGRINLKVGDYHQLEDMYTNDTFDVVLFLESLGHSHDPSRVISSCYSILKPGGCIYIKDFYPLVIPASKRKEKQDRIIERINEAYSYNVLDLNQTLTNLRQAGFEIDFIRRFEFEDDIKARSAFEDVNGIKLYDGEPEFRIAEWLEIKCTKPVFPLF